MIIKHGKVTITDSCIYIENFCFSEVDMNAGKMEAIKWARDRLVELYNETVDDLQK